MPAVTLVYEAWVRALRAWAVDPTTNLDGLPVMDESSQPPAVFQRLAKHMQDAIQQFTDNWIDQLSTRLGQASDAFARGQVMVDSKRLLARRLLLAQHPGLPASYRQALWDQACTDVRTIQSQFEEMAAQPGKTLDTSGRDLAFFRDHSLVTLLAPGFPLADFVSGRYQEPATVKTAVNPPAPLGFFSSKPRVLPTWLGDGQSGLNEDKE